MMFFRYILFSILLLSVVPYNAFAVSGSIPFNTGDAIYSIDGGNVESILLDPNFFELIILMQTNTDGLLEITIPRSVLDAKFESNDDIFFVLVDGFETDYVETQTTIGARTLAIPFFSGDTLVEIIGNTSNDSIPTPQTEIPQWIKQNAGWWHDGMITDSDFVLGIQYLITNGVMVIPPTTPGQSSSQEIPQWIKQNAGWWHDGMITDSDFVLGIQYLITNGVMRI